MIIRRAYQCPCAEPGQDGSVSCGNCHGQGFLFIQEGNPIPDFAGVRLPDRDWFSWPDPNLPGNGPYPFALLPSESLIDPVAALARLGAKISPALTGDAPLDQYACVMCPGRACDCAETPFGSDAYFAKLDAIHGRNRGAGHE
jgi:hypothetical protein